MKRRALSLAGFILGLFLITRQKNGTAAEQDRAGNRLLAAPDVGAEPRSAPGLRRTEGDERPAEQTGLDPAAGRGLLGNLKQSIRAFMDDDCQTMGAALAYYTVFSLPPLLLVIISVVGLVFGREAVQGRIQQEIQGLVGSGSAAQVGTMVQHAGQNSSHGILGTVLGLIALLFGATGTFAALQQALNKAWHVKPDPKASGWKTFLGKRILSLGMVLGIAFLLLASLAVSAALSAFGGWISSSLSTAVSGTLLHIAEAVFSLGVVTLLFAAILKILPDAEVEWRQVWMGAILTGVLFTIGKSLIGLYLGKSGAASAYGAAGSLVLIVLWVYYASLIVLFGAEFTKVRAWTHGRGIRPEPGAVRVVTQEKPVDESSGPFEHAA